MVELRRSTRHRPRPTKRTYEESEEDDEATDGTASSSDLRRGGADESEDSEDEWVPDNQNKRAVRRGGRNQTPSTDDSDEDGEAVYEEEEEEERLVRPAKRQRIAKPTRGKQLANDPIRPPKSSTVTNGIDNEAMPSLTEAEQAALDAEEDELARREAKKLWEEVRQRREAGASAKTNGNGGQKQATQNKAPGGLDGWLGIAPPAWPSTCEDAMINDRDSLFVGYVYALQSSTQAEITQCLSHLTKVVHPQSIPVERLPISIRHLASNRRGAGHDMHAWRCLTLKPGRDGLGGPEDFGLVEGQEDDGERFGAKEIAKAIKFYGATDVLVVVSRWFGGTMLGPARFRHIEQCAKAALARHLLNEAMVDLRQELIQLDKTIDELRAARAATGAGPATLSASASQSKGYDDLIDAGRAERLIMARKKQIEMLRKPAKAVTAPPSQIEQADPADQLDDGISAAEEEAALEALRQVEAEAEERERAAAIEPIPSPPSIPTEPAEPVPIVKQEPDTDVQVKLEPLADDETAAAAPLPTLPTVKEEPQDETDLTGWDEL